MSRVSDLLRIHLKVEPIVFKYVSLNESTGKKDTIYMIKSVGRKNQSYNVIFENNRWSCDCPSYKFKTGTDKEGYCKHILLIVFLLDNNVEIKET